MFGSHKCTKKNKKHRPPSPPPPSPYEALFMNHRQPHFSNNSAGHSLGGHSTGILSMEGNKYLCKIVLHLLQEGLQAEEDGGVQAQRGEVVWGRVTYYDCKKGA